MASVSFIERLSSLPKDLVAARKSKQATQNQMADLLGVPLRTYRSWEYGVRQPRGKALMRCFDALYSQSEDAADDLSTDDL